MKTSRVADVSLAAAARRDLTACVDILMDSILGEQYFKRNTAETILAQAIAKKEVTVASMPGGDIVGFYRLVLDGVFLAFAYIHLIAVKTDYRGSGIGTKLLQDAEQKILNERDYPNIKKSFLLVGQGNPRAKRYYERNSYKRVATLENLFAERDTEYLMVKELGRAT